MRYEAATTKDPGSASYECASGARNRFFRGKQMRAEDFEREQLYSIARRRLVNRSVLGWGVVSGLPVAGGVTAPSGQPESKPITVGPGFALDRHGREIVLVDAAALGASNTLIVEVGASGCQVRSLDRLEPGRYLLAVHYAERRFGDANLPESCDCGEPHKNYVCETAVFSLRALGESRCPCAEAECRRECECSQVSPSGDLPTYDTAGRGPHACLCQWVTKAEVAGEPPALCEWRGFWIDPADGVDVACVTIEKGEDRCDPVVGRVEHDCDPRRLVKSNDLLYDLARGCDLTRIETISWTHWHRVNHTIAWRDFQPWFHADGTTEFVVTFSGPVLTKTLRITHTTEKGEVVVPPDVVVMTAVTAEQATGWRLARRVPITDLDLEPDLSGGPLPDGTTNQMRLKVRTRWFDDELATDEESWLTQRPFTIEIEIFGDFIFDCHGQAVDANVVGLRAAPTGNGTPGGTFRSTFRVGPKPAGPGSDAV